MAKITMDVSEYNAVMETKKLLEQSLEKERMLQGKIEELNNEKIQALEDAKQKVVKEVRTTVSEEVVTEIDSPTYHFLAKEAEMVFYNVNNIPVRVDRLFFQSFVELIRSKCFRKTKSEARKEVSFSTVGFDEVKLELKEEAERSVKHQLARMSDLETRCKYFESAFESLSKERGDLAQSNETLTDKLKEAIARYEIAEKKLEKINRYCNTSGLISKYLAIGEIKSISQLNP